MEEFVEQNHQSGYKEEERVKRIKNADTRAQAKAKRVWISLNSGVQNHINRVYTWGKRGAYKKKREAESMQSPLAKMHRVLLVTMMSWMDG